MTIFHASLEIEELDARRLAITPMEIGSQHSLRIEQESPALNELS
jgi:hypothetical protein